MNNVDFIAGGRRTGRTTRGSKLAVDRLATGCNSVIVCHGMAHLGHVWSIARAQLDESEVVDQQRHRLSDSWKPPGPFEVNFVNGARLFVLSDPEQLFSLRANFAFLDNVVDRREVTTARMRMRELGPLGQEPGVCFTEEL